MPEEVIDATNPEVLDTKEEQSDEGTGLEDSKATIDELEGEPKAEGETPAEDAPAKSEEVNFSEIFGVKGLESIEDAAKHARELRAWAIQTSQKTAELNKRIEALGKKPEKPGEEKVSWDDRLKNHTKYDENGTRHTDYEAIVDEKVGEMLQESEKELLGKMTTTADHRAAVDRTFSAIEGLAKEKVIPDWRAPEMDGEGKSVVNPGSEFYEATDGLLGEMAKAVPEILQHPEVAKIAMYATYGYRMIEGNREANRKKLDKQAKIAGAGSNVTVPSNDKQWGKADEKTLDAELDRMEEAALVAR